MNYHLFLFSAFLSILFFWYPKFGGAAHTHIFDDDDGYNDDTRLRYDEPDKTNNNISLSFPFLSRRDLQLIW